jgi:hypothetical protein
MEVKVESHNQQGGVTAGTINNANQFTTNVNKKSRKVFWKNPWLITISGGFIVSLIILFLQVKYGG